MPTRALSLLALLPALALAASAPAPAPKKLTLVFNGDNGGEIAPCG
jgi:hypothetical protein